jgi:DNA ligase 4
VLAKSIKSTEVVCKLMQKQSFWIQEKLDGERMQLHKDGDNFKWFSRNAVEYTDIYGSSPSGGLAKSIFKCFKKEVKRYCNSNLNASTYLNIFVVALLMAR